MAPKCVVKERDSRKVASTMRLRSGPVKRKVVHDAASSKNIQNTPKKKDRKFKRCHYVGDEAVERAEIVSDEEIHEDSNIVAKTPASQLPTNLDTSNIELLKTQGFSGVSEMEEVSKHKKHFGERISLGLMSEVLSQFHIVKSSELPLVPLCRLLPIDTVRAAVSNAPWLVPLFDRRSYMETMSSFIISLKGMHGKITSLRDDIITSLRDDIMGKLDPIWQNKNHDFEANLSEEWQELRGKMFYVYDGNHRLKTWMKRIEEAFSDHCEYHVSVRCQLVEVERKREAEFLLALDTTNLITRASVEPNLGHEIILFQKFGLANKLSILERLNAEQRSWMETQIRLEFRHNVTPWYNMSCILISQLVWKERGISAWECSKCPWWLEYPLGVIPRQEHDLHARFCCLKSNIDGERKSTSTPLPVEDLQGTTSPFITTQIANTSLKKKGKEKVIDKGTSAHPLAMDEESYEEEILPPSSFTASKHLHVSKGTRSSLLVSFLGQPLSRREATKQRREHLGKIEKYGDSKDSSCR